MSFEEKEAGRAGTKRAALAFALAFPHPEDQLVVWKVDRLGRSLREMFYIAQKLPRRCVKLRSLNEAVDTETSMGRLMVNFLGIVAEYILDLNRERTEGLKAALNRRHEGSRQCKLSGNDLAVVRVMLKDALSGGVCGSAPRCKPDNSLCVFPAARQVVGVSSLSRLDRHKNANSQT